MIKKCVEDRLEIKVGKTIKKISIYKNGNNPNYYYYFRHNGEKYQGSCKSNDLETSKQNVLEICFDLTKGLRQKGYKKKIKLEDIIKRFLKYKQDEGKSPKTLVEYTRQSQYILEWYNTYSKGSDINVFFKTDRYTDYSDWRRNYYDTHNNIQTYKRKGEKIEGRMFEKVGNTSLNRECRLMCSIIRYAKNKMNIFNDIQIIPYRKLKEKSEIEEKVILDNIDEYNQIKNYWMKKNQFIWDCFGTIHHLGLRPSELNKITFGDVHLKEDYVLIRNRKTKSKPINSIVPLDQSSREIVKRLMSRDGIKKGDDDPVFVIDSSGHQYTPPYLSKLFKKSVKLITGKDMVLHSLRHLYITRYLKKQVPLKVLSDVVGHLDQTMLNRVYSHLMWKDYVDIFQKIEKQSKQPD